MDNEQLAIKRKRVFECFSAADEQKNDIVGFLEVFYNEGTSEEAFWRFFTANDTDSYHQNKGPGSALSFVVLVRDRVYGSWLKFMILALATLACFAGRREGLTVN